MHRDPKLVGAARQALRDRKPHHTTVDFVEDLIDEYESACDLSRGPSEDRSEYWFHKAKATAARLRLFLKQGE